MHQQQPQLPPHVLNSAPQLPLNAITTEQIQKFLDENKSLILAILENQNLGKLAECAQYQAILQKNLMYLAAIADAQPQVSAATSQMAPSISQPGVLMQLSQPAMMLQQQHGVTGQKLPFQLNALPSQEQQQQMLQQQYGFGPAVNNAMHQMMRPGQSSSGTPDIKGNRQGSLEANPIEGLGKSAPGRVNVD